MGTDGSEQVMQDGTLVVRTSTEGKTSVVAVSGELDMSNAATLSTALERAESEGGDAVRIDMRGLEFIDSTGIAVLVAAHRRLSESGRLRIVPSRADGVHRVLEVTGLEEELPFDAPDDSPSAESTIS